MSKIEDGGHAFPQHGITPYPGGGGFRHCEGGLSVRDYFAAKVMQGFCTQPPDAFASFEQVAKQSYELADAMLRARTQESSHDR